MEKIKKKGGPKGKQKCDLKHQVRFFIKQWVIDKYGEEENLLKPEVLEDNKRDYANR